jgi:hypothetical protein
MLVVLCTCVLSILISGTRFPTIESSVSFITSVSPLYFVIVNLPVSQRYILHHSPLVVVDLYFLVILVTRPIGPYARLIHQLTVVGNLYALQFVNTRCMVAFFTFANSAFCCMGCHNSYNQIVQGGFYL